MVEVVGEVGRDSFESLLALLFEDENVARFPDDFAPRRRDAAPEEGKIVPPLVVLERSFPGGRGINSPGWCFRSWRVKKRVWWRKWMPPGSKKPCDVILPRLPVSESLHIVEKQRRHQLHLGEFESQIPSEVRGTSRKY